VTQIFRGDPRSLQENARMVPDIKPRLLPSTPFTIQNITRTNYPTSRRYIHFDLLAALSNNLQTDK
jgi:hypothetical protein